MVVAPVTMLFGSVAGFNAAVTLAPAVSAWCMFLFLRRVTTFLPGQLAASLFWGFSPFVFDNVSLGHLFLVVGFFPPLAALIVHDVLIGHRRRPLINGVLAGLLVTAQFFTGTELLALTVLVGAIGVVIAAALVPRLFWDQRRALLSATGSAAVTSVVLLAYPLTFELVGPRHISGHIWPASVLPSGPLSGIVNPGAFVHQTSQVLAVAGYYGGQGPDGLYLGWAMLTFLGVSAVVWWRRRLAWCAVGAGLSAWILTQGADVHGWWPWHLFARLPLISEAWPARFADLIDFCAALLFAIAVEEWWKLIKARTPAPLSRRRGAVRARGLEPQKPAWRTTPMRATAVVVLVAFVVAVMVPMVSTYSLPLTVQPAHLPAWFTGTSRDLPRGARLVVIPYSPVALASQATAYQAEDGLRFDLVAGYALVPAADGTSALLQPLRGTPRTLQRLSISPEVGGSAPTASQAAAEVRRSLRHWGVQAVVVVTQDAAPVLQQFDAADAVTFVTAVYRHPPTRQDGAWVWYGRP
jgi:hypothetical protein